MPGEDDEARAVDLGFAAYERLEGAGAGEGRGVLAQPGRFGAAEERGAKVVVRGVCEVVELVLGEGGGERGGEEEKEGEKRHDGRSGAVSRRFPLEKLRIVPVFLSDAFFKLVIMSFLERERGKRKKVRKKRAMKARSDVEGFV